MEKIADGFKGEKAIITPYSIRNFQADNPVTKLLYVTHIGYYPNAKYHFRERENGTNENVFIYCERGKGWIDFNGEVHYLSKNQVFILPANQKHSYGANVQDPWSIYWIHFKGVNTDFYSSMIGRLISIEDSDKGRHADRLLLFEEIYQNLEMGYSPENLEYTSCCMIHLLASVKYVNQFREIKKAKETDAIQRSIMYMKEHLEDKLSLEDIASHAGYSVSHFGVLFSERTSYPPMVYYNQLKVQRACSYLQFSDLKIKEISFRLGFYDPFHFSKAFKLEMGISPKEYRSRYKTTAK